MLTGVDARYMTFAKAFFVDFNTRSALAKAGYKVQGNGADQQACRLLRNAKVQRYMQEEFARLQASLDIEQDRTMLETCRLAYSNMRHVAKWGPDGVELYDSETLPDDVSAAVETVRSFKKVRTHYPGGSDEPVTEEETRTEVKLHSKTAALRMLQEFFRRGDPLSADVEAKIQALVMIMAQYVSRDRLAQFRAHIYQAFGIELPASLGAGGNVTDSGSGELQRC